MHTHDTLHTPSWPPEATAAPLESLLDGRRLWRGAEARAARHAVIPTGSQDLDTTLGGGWPQGGLTEVLGQAEGPGSLSLFMPALARLSRGGQWLAWVAPPYIPYAPALAGRGLHVQSVLWIHTRPHRDTLWALEQALRSGTCAAVLGWLPKVDPVALRRLQLAAEAGDTWGIIFRPAEAARQPSPASLRLSIEASPGGVDMRVLKQRGGWPARRLFIHHRQLDAQSGSAACADREQAPLLDQFTASGRSG
ncbi:MAG TPA: translesion DNA synthesis-associated protein ImuA [Gammaproteobacteria bacterium]|nr:translesion DNA synthesis-associated protein ImuA [Gammaproteobacteria bacterium]